MNEKIGVIISLENYQPSKFGLSKVKYAINDSESMKKIFIEVLGINEKNIHYFKDEQFTHTVGQSELQYYLKQMSSNTELYIYIMLGMASLVKGKIISLHMILTL